MNFDINGLFKFFGSIYKVALVLFLSGLFLILSNDKIRELIFLKDFIRSYGVYVGSITIVSGIVLIVFIVEKVVEYTKNKYDISKRKTEIIKILRDLSLEEKQVLAHFLANKTQTSNLGIQYEVLEEESPIGVLMAKRFLHKNRIGLNPFYHVDNIIWDILQEKWQEIFYEDEFKPKKDEANA